MQQAAAAGEVFYEHRLLQPYMFFDVSSGKDERKGNGSLSNHVRSMALMMCLFAEGLTRHTFCKMPCWATPVVSGCLPWHIQERLFLIGHSCCCGHQSVLMFSLHLLSC